MAGRAAFSVSSSPSLCIPYSVTSLSLSFSNRSVLSVRISPRVNRFSEFLHVKPGKGAAFVRTKIRNYVNGSTVERTFRAGISVEEANVFKETKQFTYKDGSQFVFMDLSTYEETRLNESDMGDKTRWLKEGMDCSLLYWKDKVIDFELPNTVTLKVVDVDPGLRGDTAQDLRKPSWHLRTSAASNVSLKSGNNKRFFSLLLVCLSPPLVLVSFLRINTTLVNS
ncbi:hypothetical protein Bca4012_085642 [Brassica carinata]